MTQSRLADDGIFHYDSNTSHLATAFRMANTVVPHVFRRVEFWFFMALHIAVVVLYYYGYIPKSTKEKTVPYTMMDWNDVKVITAITTFFEVFYTNQCFSRYMHLYTVTRKLMVEMLHVCLEMRLHLRAECMQHARLSCRYLFASILIFFEDEVGHGGGSSKKKKKKLTRERLLRPEELAYLENFPEQYKSLLVMHWSAEIFMHGWRKAGLPANFQKSIVDRLYKIFAQLRDLADTMNLPIPFQYFHLLNLMVCVNLFCWAYIMGSNDSAGGTLVFFCAALIFLGMMELASQLVDPFGDDEVDFPCNKWLFDFFSRGEMLLEYHDSYNLEETWKGNMATEGKIELTGPVPELPTGALWPRQAFAPWQPSGLTGTGYAQGPAGMGAGYNRMARSGDDDDDEEDDDDE